MFCVSLFGERPRRVAAICKLSFFLLSVGDTELHVCHAVYASASQRVHRVRFVTAFKGAWSLPDNIANQKMCSVRGTVAQYHEKSAEERPQLLQYFHRRSL